MVSPQIFQVYVRDAALLTPGDIELQALRKCLLILNRISKLAADRIYRAVSQALGRLWFIHW
jgi:hypothetical protein